MEDLWKDIQLSSLHENPTTNSTTTIFQDFLSPRRQPPPSATARGGGPRDEEDQTAASMGNARCFKASNSINSQLNPLAVASSASSFACSPNYVRLSCFSRKNKRVSEGDQHKNDDSGGDPRYKRMMKNRESAARSRARRQVPPLFLSVYRCLLIPILHLLESNYHCFINNKTLRVSINLIESYYVDFLVAFTHKKRGAVSHYMFSLFARFDLFVYEISLDMCVYLFFFLFFWCVNLCFFCEFQLGLCLCLYVGVARLIRLS